MVNDGVIVMISGEFRTGDTSPKDDAGVEPSKDVSSDAEAEDVEELEATENWVMVESEGSMECRWFWREGEVGVEEGGEYVSLEGKDREGIEPGRRGDAGPGGGFSLWTNVVVDEDGDAEEIEVKAWWVGECTLLGGYAKLDMVGERGCFAVVAVDDTEGLVRWEVEMEGRRRS